MVFLIAKQFSLLLLLIISLFLSCHARESQSFNKFSRINPKKQQQEEEYRNFVQENDENSYGLYGHQNTGGAQTPPSAPTVSTPPYLPSNYRTDSYVTQSEDTINDNMTEKDTIDSTTLAEDTSRSYTKNDFTNYNNAAALTVPTPPYRPPNYNSFSYVTNVEEEEEDTKYSTPTKNPFTNNNYKTYQNTQLQNKDQYNYPTTTSYIQEDQFVGSTEQQRQQEYSNNKVNNNYRESTPFYSQQQPPRQGMSDTRYLQKGMFHYDLNTENYNKNHPFSYYRNNQNANRYQRQQYQSQDEEMP